jgi:hypothetical protein
MMFERMLESNRYSTTLSLMFLNKVNYLEKFSKVRFPTRNPWEHSSFLDIAPGGVSMCISPPIRFRIEWACRQGIVTAPCRQAHFNFAVQIYDFKLVHHEARAGQSAGSHLMRIPYFSTSRQTYSLEQQQGYRIFNHECHREEARRFREPT